MRNAYATIALVRIIHFMIASPQRSALLVIKSIIPCCIWSIGSQQAMDKAQKNRAHRESKYKLTMQNHSVQLSYLKPGS